MKKPLPIIAACIALSACSTTNSAYELVSEPAKVASVTSSQRELLDLPAPSQRLTVAVYNFQDQTGQFRGGETAQSLSRVVSQGATSMLVKALQDAGDRRWFQVMERERLDNLLKERQIIREMRQRYLGEEQVNPEALPSLMFAGLLLEGGVIGYDTNTVSGGAGARYLGIGASTEYRQDTVTVYLRAVSVKTGEVLMTVVSKKTVASIGIRADAFKYVAFRELLEAEAGVTTNEPDQVALQQAIEKAVHSLILEGSQLGYWRFSDPIAANELLHRYRAEREGAERSALASPRPKDSPKYVRNNRPVAMDDRSIIGLAAAFIKRAFRTLLA
jgi:curli production assembly/transport component CsgG